MALAQQVTRWWNKSREMFFLATEKPRNQIPFDSKIYEKGISQAFRNAA